MRIPLRFTHLLVLSVAHPSVIPPTLSPDQGVGCRVQGPPCLSPPSCWSSSAACGTTQAGRPRERANIRCIGEYLCNFFANFADHVTWVTLRGCLLWVVGNEQNADANARRTVDRFGFDQCRDGEHIRAYQLKCVSGFFRAIETYRKYQAKKRAEGRERTGEHARLTATDRARRRGDASRWATGIEASQHVPDGAFLAKT